MSATAPGSNSMVVIAAVDPTTNTVMVPELSPEPSSALVTSSVTSWTSPCPRVRLSKVWVETMATSPAQRDGAGVFFGGALVLPLALLLFGFAAVPDDFLDAVARPASWSESNATLSA